MRSRLVVSLSVLIAGLSRGTVAALAVVAPVTHRAPGCIVAGRFSAIDGSLDRPGEALGVRLYFRAADASAWHYTTAEVGLGGTVRAYLPRPGPSIAAVEYFFAVRRADSRYESTETFRVRVARAGACQSAGLNAAPTEARIQLAVEPAELDSPAVPEGFLLDDAGDEISVPDPIVSADVARSEAVSDSEEASELLTGGAEALQRGDGQGALALLGRLQEIRPDDPLAMELIERARAQVRERARAENESRQREALYLNTALATAERLGDRALAAEYQRRLAELDAPKGSQSNAESVIPRPATDRESFSPGTAPPERKWISEQSAPVARKGAWKVVECKPVTRLAGGGAVSSLRLAAGSLELLEEVYLELGGDPAGERQVKIWFAANREARPGRSTAKGSEEMMILNRFLPLVEFTPVWIDTKPTDVECVLERRAR